MKKNTSIYIPPFWSLILMIAIPLSISLILSLCGVERVHFGTASTSTTVRVVGFLGVALIWQSFELDELGINRKRLFFIKKTVRWENVSQIAKVNLGKKKPGPVVLIVVFNTTPSKKILTRQDAPTKFLLENFLHTFVLYAEKDDLDKQIEHYILEHWGSISEML